MKPTAVGVAQHCVLVGTHLSWADSSSRTDRVCVSAWHATVLVQEVQACTKGDAMAWWWQRCSAGRRACERRRPGHATALFVAVMVMTGSVACSAGQEDPKGKQPSDGAAGTAPTSPSDEPSQIKTPPSVSTTPVDTECLGRPVTIVGTAGPDRLVGGPRRDVFLALGGDDLVTNVGNRDRVCAGGGDDRVATFKGEMDSRVDLGAGDDTFRGATHSLVGGTGDDRLHVWMGTDVQPDTGRDLIVAMPVKDRYSAACVSYTHVARGIAADLTRGWVQAQGRDRVRGVQCLYGTQFADRITGSARDDLLYLCAWGTGTAVDRGRNIVDTGAGDDEVHGCDGGDRVSLGDGRDLFIGGEGDDWAHGGEGPDWIHGNYGSDHLEGADGNDRVNGTFYCDTGSSAGDGMGDTSPNQVYGGNGDDEVTGDLAADLLDGGPGVDNGYGGPPGSEGRDVIISVERRSSCP